MLNFYSKFTKSLKSTEIKKILYLKNTFWKFNYKSQLKFFKENIYNNDIHNMVYMNKKLIGYTLLRKRKFKQNKYLLFDTLIVHKNYRNKKIGSKLMKLNMRVIKKNNLKTILICKKNLVNFYLNFNWKLNNKVENNQIILTANKNQKPIRYENFLILKNSKKFF